ncbi:MAG: cob(I)yrinic acid a,c-diamide adenosyltransferase [Candidatus Aenigmarchaeota archaeon]|nr:cob(I)yrinic acid a,c-diamide adenosyltransferase [Candidatus Aenigmarchaeota archaeon]
MSIATKTGDYGETSFANGERVAKDDVRIEAYGTLDELNSLIGVTLTHLYDEYVRTILLRVQHDLFTLGAELASMSPKTQELKLQLPKITPQHVLDIEHEITALEDKLPVQKSFILPNGTPESCYLHLTRTICRKVERIVVGISRTYHVNQHVLIYLNRLSDLLYLLARWANKEVKEQQPIYKYFEKKS